MARLQAARTTVRRRAARAARLADRGRDVARATYGALQYRSAFTDIERYCTFIGYPRSGHSLVGSLLNAHPELLIAHEFNAFRYARLGVPRTVLFALARLRDEGWEQEGRTWAGYQYEVPNQHQGSFTRLRVIGDKRGGDTAELLGRDPGLLDIMKRRVDVPLMLIHLVRNPFDNVATIANRGHHSDRPADSVAHGDLEGATRFYLRLVEVNAALMRSEGDRVCTLHHEQFVRAPAAGLSELCDFLGVAATPDYLEDAASIVFDQPRRTRDSVTWTPALRGRIEDAIARHDFLSDYRFDN